MFCNTPQVNQLTALLLSHQIKDVVVCPGSRNATIVHNLNELKGSVNIHPITDERSAAFVALGMVLATDCAVAVCVTSGSALLNCIPAVAEAYYRHLPLLVISADRPSQWINQLDGQTLNQVDALMPYCPTFSVRPSRSEVEYWSNNRNINQAFLYLQRNGGTPSHINIEIEEPMFNFTTEELPNELVVKLHSNINSGYLPQEVIKLISDARLPVLLVGQYEKGDIRHEVNQLAAEDQLLVLPEIISDVKGNYLMNAFDELSSTSQAVTPDVVVQIGGNFVHKKFKSLLRNTPCKIVRIGYDDYMPDTFCQLNHWIQADVAQVLKQLVSVLPKNKKSVLDARLLLEKTSQQLLANTTINDELSFNMVLKNVSNYLHSDNRTSFTLHLANSTAVRAASLVFESGCYPIFCNRGVNGIEGSLSVAVGYAMKMWGLHIVVIGDLSFFYDANALWNVALPSNLRILLINNGRGGIFDHLSGLSVSPARNDYIAAGKKHYTAQGICQTFAVDYTKAETTAQLLNAIPHWLNEQSTSAKLLEVSIS